MYRLNVFAIHLLTAQNFARLPKKSSRTLAPFTDRVKEDFADTNGPATFAS